MRVPHIFHPDTITLNQSFELSEDGANHVGRVLRLGQGQTLRLFNGDNHEYLCEIESVAKKTVVVKAIKSELVDLESPIDIHLGQVISRGDKMEFTLQKAVELGVSAITPLFSERCGVKLQGDRLAKKVNQWQKVVISACEQCGRNKVPKVHEPTSVENWIGQYQELVGITLDPVSNTTIKELPTPTQGVKLLIGPEGGLSADEISDSLERGFKGVSLGPRILRTETAALTAISTLQSVYGDLT